MRSGEGAVAPGAIENGRVVDPAAVALALRHLLARSEITGTRALIAASDSIASLRVITFPKSATDVEIDREVKSQLNLDPDRMAIRYVEVAESRDERTFFAVVWERSAVQGLAAAVRNAGLEPLAVDLKSLCIARAIPVDSGIVLDMSVDPCETVLIDDRVPRVCHTFKVDSSSDLALSLANGLKPVLGFHQRSGARGLGADAPILVLVDQALPSLMSGRLEELTGHRLEALPQPPRIDPAVRYGPFLTCIGLVMRRHG